MRRSDILHILRNPFGYQSHIIREARLAACDEIEALIDGYENLRKYAESQGLNITITLPAESQPEPRGEEGR